MLDNLLQGFGKGGSENILLIFLVIFLFSGGLDGIFGDDCDGGFDSNILLIFLVLFLMGDIF